MSLFWENVSRTHKTSQHLQSASLSRPDFIHIFTRFLRPRLITCAQPWNISPLTSIWSFLWTLRFKANHYNEIKTAMKSYFGLWLIKLATLLKWREVMNGNTTRVFYKHNIKEDIFVFMHSKWSKALVVSHSSKTDEYQEQKAHADLPASLCFHSAVLVTWQRLLCCSELPDYW